MDETQILVDFSKRDGVPLIKKFGLFNSGIVPLSQYERDAHFYDEIRADSLRIDLYMGDDRFMLGDMVDGTVDNMIYDFTTLDTLIDLLREHGVDLYASWCYIPKPLQINNDYRTGPSDLTVYKEMFRTFARHYKELGIRIPYHEIYNEPDCGDVFFTGGWDDYTKMYIAAVQGLLEADKDAVVGGPSTAFIDITGVGAIKNFLEEISKADVPLDFFSHHSYGCDKKQYLVRTNLAQTILGQYPEYDTTEIHLNEFNSLIQPFTLGGDAEKSRGAATMLTSFELLLEETDVTLAHWAQFMDTGYEPLGAIDTEGMLKAPYWALWMYSRMPEERVRIEGLPDVMREGLHAMASADEETAAILLWNDSKTERKEVSVKISSIPITEGKLRIYRMDDSIYDYVGGDRGCSVVPSEIVDWDGTSEEFSISLEPGGFALYLFGGEEKKEDTEPVGTLVRKYYEFTEREKANYSFYDITDPKVYLGMNGETSARSIVAVEYEDLPDMIMVESNLSGTYENVDYNTVFQVRIDYEVDGEYVTSYQLSYRPVNERRNRVLRWGTGRKADEEEVVSTLLTGNTQISLKEHAPEGWDGRAIITFEMNSTGKDTCTEITMKPINDIAH
ncbi:MAG: hypothetical protein HDR26_05520 [Lachnospiraceae bacterium]|nr:hypothetical protein [Lachnospiraceae bacterium]